MPRRFSQCRFTDTGPAAVATGITAAERQRPVAVSWVRVYDWLPPRFAVTLALKSVTGLLLPKSSSASMPTVQPAVWEEK